MLQVQEIKRIIEKEKTSSFQREARVGQNYYDGHNDIEKYKLFYYDSNGNLVEDKTRSNIKISHSFFKELVDQLVQYMLSGTEGYVFSNKPELQEKLDEQFNHNDDFNSEIYDLIEGVSIKGSEYMYLYKDRDEKLKFEVADSLGIAEVRARDTSDNCDYVVRWYVDRFDKDGEPIRKIEVWDKEATTFFIEEGDKGIKLDENVKINPRPHILTVNLSDGKMFGSGFGYIPFFRMDNNKKRVSDLNLVKSLIDDYDLMNCSLSNNLQDLTEGIFAVKGFEGDSLEELINNVKTKKMIGIAEGGDIDIKTVDIPYEARKIKMEIDEENIYRFGFGFNSSQVGDGNITNIVIKSRYALLDLKCNKLEIRLKQFMRKILKIVLAEINDQNEADYQMNQVYFQFDHEIMSNALENAQISLIDAQEQQARINTLMSLATQLGDKLLMQNICDVLELDYSEVKDMLPDPDEADNSIDGAVADSLIKIVGVFWLEASI